MKQGLTVEGIFSFSKRSQEFEASHSQEGRFVSRAFMTPPFFMQEYFFVFSKTLAIVIQNCRQFLPRLSRKTLTFVSVVSPFKKSPHALISFLMLYLLEWFLNLDASLKISTTSWSESSTQVQLTIFLRRVLNVPSLSETCDNVAAAYCCLISYILRLLKLLLLYLLKLYR